MQGRFLRIIFILLLMAVAVYLAIPLFTIAELLYPVRIDSVYQHNKQLNYESDIREGKEATEKNFFYQPEQLSLISDKIIVTTKDSIHLKGWHLTDSTINSNSVIIIIPDIAEGSLNYFEFASALVNRGFPLCVMDMRAQGESKGNFYTMGKAAATDISVIADSLSAQYQYKNFVIFGNGTGAAIALQAACYDKRINITVLQNPFLNLENYLAEYAQKKYGVLSSLFYKRMKMNYEKITSFPSDSINLLQLVEKSEQPSMFIYLQKESIVMNNTNTLFKHSAAGKKQFIYADSEKINNNEEQKKIYFDKIAAFINGNLPQINGKKLKLKKFAHAD